FVEQVELAKSSTVVTHMRFYFQSPNCRQEIPCEAMLFGAADAMIVILRRCKPFIRKQLITAASPSDYFASASSSSSSYRSSSRSSYNGSQGQSYSNSYNDSQGGQSCSNSYNDSYNNSYSTTGNSIFNRGSHDRSLCSQSRNKMSMASPFAFASPPESVASSYSSSRSGASDRPGHRSYRVALRNVAIGSINSIRNLDQEHTLLRPLTSLHENEDDIVDSNTTLPAVYRLRKHQAMETGVDEVELEAGMEQLGLEDDDDDYEYDNYEDDDHNYQYMHGHEMEELIELDMNPTGKRREDWSGGGGGGGGGGGDQSMGERH
ncbi:hypothetical protein BGZ58_003868, partial [Dissophora ornata]